MEGGGVRIGVEKERKRREGRRGEEMGGKGIEEEQER